MCGRILLAALAALAATAVSAAQDEGVFVNQQPECASEPEVFVLPTTGVPFSLPQDHDAGLERCAPDPPPPVRPAAPNLFRMIAMPIGNSAPQSKWEYARLGTLAARRGPWDELISEARRLAPADPVAMVNQWVNWHVRYRDDIADEWASAEATLVRGYGDCEDFALAKMGLLAELGISPDDMYLVLLRDQRQAEHAVLAVKHNGRLHVLDNRTDKVLPADAIADYTPVLSFSGPFAWTYGRRAS